MNNNPTVLEIGLSSMDHNLDFFRSRLKKGTKILAVVKASGYGSDAVSVARFLERKGVDYFAVAYTDEGIALREAGVTTPILVLHPQLPNLELIVKYKLEPNLYSKKIFHSFLELADKMELTQYPIHIKFNTGLNRLGFKPDDKSFLLTHLKDQKSVVLRSVFSHLVASEDENEKDYSMAQIRTFKETAAFFTSAMPEKPILHMSNTSGILNYPEAHFDMVRLGLGLYGFTNDLILNRRLKNVMSLRSIISQIHVVEKSENVGYNMGFIAKRRMKTATMPLGHADGFFRCLGQGKVFVTINGQKAPIIGNVCMDMVMIDVTDISCEEGDEVIVFDSQEEILELASKANTISYEILTAFGQRIRRVSV